MQDQEHPDLAHLASTLASNQAKVQQYVETLTCRVDDLVAAAIREDWDHVRHVSQEIAQQGRSSGHRAVSAMAQRVYDEAHQPNDGVGVKRSLIRLIGTCGRAD